MDGQAADILVPRFGTPSAAAEAARTRALIEKLQR
jgi:hypothetical protein